MRGADAFTLLAVGVAGEEIAGFESDETFALGREVAVGHGDRSFGERDDAAAAERRRAALLRGSFELAGPTGVVVAEDDPSRKTGNMKA